MIGRRLSPLGRTGENSRDEDLDDLDPMREPAMVTPAVLWMCREDAPTGKVIQAGNGRFSTAAMFKNAPLKFGPGVSFEELLEHSDELSDMSQATEGRK